LLLLLLERKNLRIALHSIPQFFRSGDLDA
jgi:hypothetical protein